MKEFTYIKLEDYLAKADNYKDEKTIKMYQILTNTPQPTIRAVVYLHTAIMAWETKVSLPSELLNIEKSLEEHGHAHGIIKEVSPAIRMG